MLTSSSSTYVREIRFSTLQIQKPAKYQPIESWEVAAKQLGQKPLSESNLLQVIRHQSQHQRYYEAQQMLLRDSLCVKIIQNALKRLPSLERFDIVWASWKIGAKELRSVFGATL